MNSCDQVLDGLYLGDKNAACDLQLLAKLKVTHVLTAELIPLPHLVTSTFPNMAVMNVQIADLPDSDLLSHLENTSRFIREGLETSGRKISTVSGASSCAGGEEEFVHSTRNDLKAAPSLSSPNSTVATQAEKGGGSVLVHCYHGISRSAAIITAYIMKSRGLGCDEALTLVRSHRPSAAPNEGFYRQLRLYEHMGCRIDQADITFKLYRLQCIHQQIRRTKILPSEVRAFRDASVKRHNGPDESDLSNQIQGGSTTARREALVRAGGRVFRCKRCRSVLFTRAAGVLPHPPGKSVTWISMLEKQIDFDECRHGVFVEPAGWMPRVFSAISDSLNCGHCGAKLGSFSWSTPGVKCACGAQQVPGFVINLARVDACTMVKEVEIDL